MLSHGLPWVEEGLASRHPVRCCACLGSDCGTGEFVRIATSASAQVLLDQLWHRLGAHQAGHALVELTERLT